MLINQQQCNQHHLLSIMHHSIRLRMNLPCLIKHLRYSYHHSLILLLVHHMNHHRMSHLHCSYKQLHLYSQLHHMNLLLSSLKLNQELDLNI